MAAGRSGSRALSSLLILALVAAAWVSAPAFLQPSAPLRTSQPAQQVASVAGLTAASWMLETQPAFAEGAQYPGLPYVVVFLGVFALLFIIPNTIWK